MASSERVVINPDHLLSGDGSLRTALWLWSSRNEPILLNKWQSLYFGLIRDHGYSDEEAAAGESAADRQVRMKRLYTEIQSEVHGQDHKAAALLVHRPTALGQPTIQGPSGATALVPFTEV